jgi:hypothetical protein
VDLGWFHKRLVRASRTSTLGPRYCRLTIVGADRTAAARRAAPALR